MDQSPQFCPYCKSINFHKNGKDYKHVQRYRCIKCNRTFKSTTNKANHGLHKQQLVKKYLRALELGMSVRKAAHFTGISKNTSFAWRHKFLSSLNTHKLVQSSASIKQIQIFNLEYSAKGRLKPPETHTGDVKNLMILESGHIRIIQLKPLKQVQEMSKLLYFEMQNGVIAPRKDALLTKSLRHSGINNAVANPFKNKAQEKLLNSCVRLFQWMQRFRGVASKYLQHYWNWHCTVNNIKNIKNAQERFILCCTSGYCLMQYREIRDK